MHFLHKPTSLSLLIIYLSSGKLFSDQAERVMGPANHLSNRNSSVYWVEPSATNVDFINNETLFDRNAQEWCGTMPWFESRHPESRSCNLYGITDDPDIL